MIAGMLPVVGILVGVVIVLALASQIAVAVCANHMGRNPYIWLGLAMLCTPIVAMLMLIAIGGLTPEQRAAEVDRKRKAKEAVEQAERARLEAIVRRRQGREAAE